jgi:hypothetical protein
VSNTSPINYLVLIDEIEVLPRLFGEVFIPQAVLNELLHPAAPPLVREFMNAPPQWLRITQALITSMEGLEHLDTGEAEAILLTAATGARLIVMDDRAGAAAAGKRGLRNHRDDRRPGCCRATGHHRPRGCIGQAQKNNIPDAETHPPTADYWRFLGLLSRSKYPQAKTADTHNADYDAMWKAGKSAGTVRVLSRPQQTSLASAH